MSLKTQPPDSDQKNTGKIPLAIKLAVIALGAAVLAGLGLVAKEGTKAGDKNMWKK